jgi:hypothetical protein
LIFGKDFSDSWKKFTKNALSLDNSGNLQDNSGNLQDNSGNLQDNSYNNVNEVFNISNNLYTYDDAPAVCSALGARIATYDEIEDAYKNGGEWCNYGWSDGQMAFFPTQKSTWNKLQKNPDHKNNCGRPGINGGYMANPYLKFGVNCYGKKPAATTDELKAMDSKKNIIYPKNQKDELLDKKVQFWKENTDKLLNINSFNENRWSER